MSNKHPKPGTSRPHPDPNKDGAQNQKRNISGDVHVCGEIMVQPGPKESLSRDAEAIRQDAKDDKRRRLEIATLVIVTIYAGLTAWQGYLTHQLVITAHGTFRATNRPYLGQSDIGVTFVRKDDNGRLIPQTTPSPDTYAMAFEAQIKNFGSIPSTRSASGWTIWIDHKKIPQNEIPPNGITMYPTQAFHFHHQIFGPNYQAISKGTSLVVDVWTKYEWPDGHDGNCTRSQYLPAYGGFITLGQANCDQAPN